VRPGDYSGQFCDLPQLIHWSGYCSFRSAWHF